MRVVLVGPMSGLPDYGDAAFEEAAVLLRASGAEVWSPHERGEIPVRRSELEAWRHWMRISLARIVTWAEAICVLDGWRESEGARLEVQVAEALGLIVGHLVILG